MTEPTTGATAAKAKETPVRSGYDFTKGVPATIACTFAVPTLPGSPFFTHRLRRRTTGVEMSDFLERLTADAVGVDDPVEKEARRQEAERYVYGQLMTDDVEGCGVEGYGEQDSMSPSACVDFFTHGPKGLDDDTLAELRRHVGFALSNWLRQKSSDGSFR